MTGCGGAAAIADFGATNGVPVATSRPVSSSAELTVATEGSWAQAIGGLRARGETVRVTVSANGTPVRCADFLLVLSEATARAFDARECADGTTTLVLKEPDLLVDRTGLVTAPRDIAIPTATRVGTRSSRDARCVADVRPYILGVADDVTYLTPGRFSLEPLEPDSLDTANEYLRDPRTNDAVALRLTKVQATADADRSARRWRLTASATAGESYVSAKYRVVDLTSGQVVLVDRAALACAAPGRSPSEVAPPLVPVVMPMSVTSSLPVHGHFDVCTNDPSHACVLRAQPGDAMFLTNFTWSTRHGSGTSSTYLPVVVPENGGRLTSTLPTYSVNRWLSGVLLLSGGVTAVPLAFASDSTATRATVISLGGAAIVGAIVLLAQGPVSILPPDTVPLHPRFAFDVKPTAPDARGPAAMTGATTGATGTFSLAF